MNSRLALLLAVMSHTAVQSAERPPNVVLIMADDVGYECFGAYGSRQYQTPRIDKLADAGVRFTNCHSTPLCTPSRVALMTGASNVRNYADFGSLLPDQYTIADLFGDAGYATAVAGKWQLQGGGKTEGVPAGHGFDTYCLWNTSLTERRRFWDPSLESDGKILEVAENDYGPDIFADFLLRFIETNAAKPFFVYYPMVLVHSPFVPTPHSADRQSKDEQKNFEDMVAYTDVIVGRIHDKLEGLDLLRNTVFVFTSDNGTHHTLASRLGDATIVGDKGAPTDAGTHVPLIVNAPGLVPGGRVIDDLIDFADFLPTLADAAGLAVPAQDHEDGRSFWERLPRQARAAPGMALHVLLPATVRDSVRHTLYPSGGAVRQGQALQALWQRGIVRCEGRPRRGEAAASIRCRVAVSPTQTPVRPGFDAQAWFPDSAAERHRFKVRASSAMVSAPLARAPGIVLVRWAFPGTRHPCPSHEQAERAKVPADVRRTLRHRGEQRLGLSPPAPDRRDRVKRARTSAGCTPQRVHWKGRWAF